MRGIPPHPGSSLTQSALDSFSFDAYCFPQRNWADVIVPRGADNHVAIAMLVETLRTMLVEYDCECAMVDEGAVDAKEEDSGPSV